VYLDDILIFSKTVEDHQQHVYKVLRKLLDAKLLVELEKSRFHIQEVDFLGCTIELGRVRMQKNKIQAIKEWLTPKTVMDVRAFLGYTNFYRKFIKGYSSEAQLLTDLTKKDRIFGWTDDAKAAFAKIKTAILEDPVLWEPNPERPYEVETDASRVAIGG